MTFEIKRQERETNQTLIRRFTKRLKTSGILLKARSARFYGRKKSAQMKKKAVLRKIQKREEYIQATKMGIK